MPIERLFRAACGNCGSRGPFGCTGQDAVAEALKEGWSAYPVLCPLCNTAPKEKVVTNKIAGLYVQLAKALNALEAAGEDLEVEDGAILSVSGSTGEVQRVSTDGRWLVVQS